MKKLWRFLPLMALCLVLLFFLPQQANAASESDLTFKLNSDGESYSVTDCATSASGELMIPSTYNGKPVTSIGDYAFSWCARLTSITIPDSVTSIGNSAFSYCDRLIFITILEGVTAIPDSAFSSCDSLTSITIPDGVTSIGDNAFSGCTSLTSITISDSVTSIGDYAFYYCTSLTSITIPSGVTSIGEDAFCDCYRLTSITISDSVTSIGDNAFSGCTKLVYNICNDDKYLGNENNPYLILVRGSSNITSCDIHENTRIVGSYAFSGCYRLTSVTIPGSVTSIGSSAFHNCDSLTGIWVDEKNTAYSNDEYGILFDKEKTELIQAPGGIQGSYMIPSSVTSIGDNAFSRCNSLTSVTIPDSVTSIGSSAFSNCNGLTSITIGDSVTDIGSSAFSACNNLTSITIGDSVTSIGDYAFGDCTSLTSVTIPDSATSIGEDTFLGCSSLVYSIYDNGKYLGNKNNHYLILVDIVSSSITSCNIHENTRVIGSSVFKSCTSLTSVTIGNNVTSIGDRAFYDCDGLTSITIPDGVTSIGEGAFSDCKSLTSINIPDGVTSIGDYAFSCCTSLTSVIIPDDVASIGTSAFSYCTRLKHVAYGGTSVQWSKISVGSDNSYLTGASVRHYEASEEDVYYNKNCVNAGMFCSLCNDFLTKEKAESGTHVYENGEDTYCDDCGYTRTVKRFYVSTQPTQKEIPLLIGTVDTAGGRLRLTYSDGTYGYIDMTPDMVTGFDNRVYGEQTLTVTYGGCTATYTVKCVAASTPDKLEILTKPNQTSYLLKQTVSLTGLTLKATYGDAVVVISETDVTMDAVDMTTVGVKTVTVRFYDATATFQIYVHEKQTQSIDSSLYPESAHNYASNTNEIKTFTYPGAGSLVLTFSSSSYTESNCDFVYLYDGAGSQIGKYSGDLAGRVVTVPGDTVQIKLTSDGSVNKYGYAFTSITAETILHPGEFFCEICGEFTAKAGETATLTENTTLDSLTIPAGVTIDLNGKVLTVDSLASFGQIVDSVGSGKLIATNIEITSNEWLPIQDSTGCYRFYEYKMESLGNKADGKTVTFGFSLEFADTTAYSALMNTTDAQLTVTLSWGENTKTVAFSKYAIQRYRKLQKQYPDMQVAMLLRVTGVDGLEKGTALTVTPSLTAVGGKLQTTGATMTYTA